MPCSAKTLAVLLPLALCCGCSRQLTRSTAAELIKADPEWSKPVTATASIGGVAPAGSDMSFERKLQSLGYAEVKGPLDRSYQYTYIVDLTEKGQKALRERGWKLDPVEGADRMPKPYAQTLTIPVGAFRGVDISGIVGDEKNASVDFTVTVDCTDTGKELGCNPSEKRPGKRGFTRYDDGWRLDPVRGQ